MDAAKVREELRRAPLGAGWTVCTHAESVALAQQLEREVGPGHALHGRPCVAVAKRGACEDVLYFSEGALAEVRLTWRVPRDRGAFPWVRVFESVGAWRGA